MTDRKTMRAAQFDRYGTPEVLQVSEVSMPTPRPGDVLVRVHAASINQHDLLVRAGRLRMITGSNLPLGTGLDFAGEVAATDRESTGFEVGERVWGSVSPTGKHRTAAAAEYVTVPASRLARTPDRLNDIEAAALVVVGVTAHVALKARANLQPSERILVRGAAGGVGAAAVQLAHAMGAHVTALASAMDSAYVRSLGADEVLDYRTLKIETLPEFDVILDTAGTRLWQLRRRLASGGRMVTVNFGSPGAMLTIALSSIFGSRRVQSFSANPTRRDLEAIATYIQTETLRPQVGKTFTLDMIVEAHLSAEKRGKRGKGVLIL